MRLKAPKVPTAATAAFNASTGPRVLPGSYTVKMTKDKNVYSTQLVVTADPRATYTAEDRKAQFELAMKLYNLLGDMTFAVDRINGVRAALGQRLQKLPANDPLVARLRLALAQTDELRKKIVATKEGGAITGEERLRENLADLYGNVNNYEGRPSQTQIERADAIARELTDVVSSFESWLTKEMPGLNSDLVKQKLDRIEPLTREVWEKGQ
jgi:hypothetical protein